MQMARFSAGFLFLCVMVELTLSELNSSLSAVRTPVVGYNPLYFHLYEILWATGCRPGELLDKSRWSYSGGVNVRLQPLKGNSVRVFPASLIPDYFKDWVRGENNLFDGLTVRQLEYSFKFLYQYPVAFKGDKRSVLYLFRYRVAKAMHASGMSIAQVTEYFGWSSEAIALGYINSQIFADV